MSYCTRKSSHLSGMFLGKFTMPVVALLPEKKSKYYFLCCATADREKADWYALGSAIHIVAAFVFLILEIRMLHLVLGID